MYREMEIASHQGSYQVRFGHDSIDFLNKFEQQKTHFLVDSTILNLYSETIGALLESKSYLKIEAVEKSKSLEEMPKYVAYLLEQGIRRDHKIVAIGGGIIQDISCFLSATLLRGVPWIFVPTTLLAQADSCIGSKSSINCVGTKNILGTFTPPQEIYIDTEFLKTLSDADIRSGIGEIVKVHIIDGRDSFDGLSKDYDALGTSPEVLKKYILRSLEIKKRIIEIDEFDKGIRNIMNYGHTFGHALEAASNFELPHGIAVTIGMDMANFVSQEMGISSNLHFERMHRLLVQNYSIERGKKLHMDKFWGAIAKDKKNLGRNSVGAILIDSRGVPFKTQIPNDQQFRDRCLKFLRGYYF